MRVQSIFLMRYESRCCCIFNARLHVYTAHKRHTSSLSPRFIKYVRCHRGTVIHLLSAMSSRVFRTSYRRCGRPTRSQVPLVYANSSIAPGPPRDTAGHYPPRTFPQRKLEAGRARAVDTHLDIVTVKKESTRTCSARRGGRAGGASRRRANSSRDNGLRRAT